MLLPYRLRQCTRQLDVHADDVDIVDDGRELLRTGAVRLEEERRRDERTQRVDEIRLQQRLAAREAHGLMRHLPQQAIDFLRRLRERERVLYLSERAAARMRLHLADGVLPRRVLRVAVAAGEIAPGKAHENLATADILALALDR